MAPHAIEGVLRTFFNNSIDLVSTALMKRRQARLSPEQIQRYEKLIAKAGMEGR